MSPIHEAKHDGAVLHELAGQREGSFQEIYKLSGIHFARGHGELVVLGLTAPADMALNWHVVGWIDNNKLRFLAFHQKGIGFQLQRITTDQTVFKKELEKEFPSAQIDLEWNFIDIRVLTATELLLYEIKSDLEPRTVIRQALGHAPHCFYRYYVPSYPRYGELCCE